MKVKMPLTPNIQYRISNICLRMLFVFLGTVLIMKEISAQEVNNNKFGIHLAQPHFEDLIKVKELVNSNGGDWGYVTLVIQENDRNQQKWQDIFDRLRRLHLIPIIRLATKPEGENWRRPKPDEAQAWADFLDSLNWVVKDRYVILFNEPNHASEWGGEVDPISYQETVLAFARALKQKNKDFFLMLSGFDASAPHQPPKYWDEVIFLKTVFSDGNIKKELEELISGWASHSYPNPDFAGSPFAFGRGSIRTYQWELNLLKELGANKSLPVFITETGWKRNNYGLNEEVVANYFKLAFENVWLVDEQIKAATPFIFDYQMNPFLDFSWKRLRQLESDNNQFYSQYYVVQAIKKNKGQPEQVEKGKIIFNLPSELVAESFYHLKIRLINQGQAVWEKDDGYFLTIVDEENSQIDYLFDDLKNLQPFEEKDLNFILKTKEPGKKRFFFLLKKENKQILKSSSWSVLIDPLPSLGLNINLFPKIIDQGHSVEVQIFDQNEQLIFKKKGIKFNQKTIKVDNIQNVVIGGKYRVVVLIPYYLPRQAFVVFKKDSNQVSFRPFLPFDFNQDGRLSLADFFSLIKKPTLMFLFFPW